MWASPVCRHQKMPRNLGARPISPEPGRSIFSSWLPSIANHRGRFMRERIGEIVIGFGHWIVGAKSRDARGYAAGPSARDTLLTDADVALPAIAATYPLGSISPSEESPPAVTSAATDPNAQQLHRFASL